MKKVYICGVVASGKGLLRPLLDGHPKIVTCPYGSFGLSLLKDSFISCLNQDREPSLKALLSHQSSKKIFVHNNGEKSKISIGELFNYLFKFDNFKDLVDSSLSGEIRAASSVKNEIFVDFTFNLFAFIESFVKKIVTIGEFFSPEELQDVLYKCFIEHWENIHNTYSDNSYYVVSPGSGFSVIEAILRKNKERKIIVVVRDPVAVSFTNTKRIVNKFKEAASKRNRFHNPFDSILYHKDFIRKVRNFREKVTSLDLPNENIYVVKFEDLTLNTKVAMDGIADFLGIEKNNILYRATLNSQPLESDSVKFTGEINDDPYKNLSKSQVELLKYFYSGPDKQKNKMQNLHLFLKAFKWQSLQAAAKWKRRIGLR